MEISNKLKIKDKVVIITGSGRGNGYQMAKDLSNLGANIFRLDLKHKKIKSKKVYDYKVDINNYELVKKIVSTIFKKKKRIDALINNAGISLQSNSVESINLTINTNLISAMKLSYLVADYMKKRGTGSIINITSLGAHLGFLNNPSYQVSKSGLSQMTRAIAKDYGKNGIRCNSICPGYIKTDMTLQSYKNITKRKIYQNKTMLKRWGNPEDLSGACLFLLSDLSSYVTASEIVVDGGWSKNSY